MIKDYDIFYLESTDEFIITFESGNQTKEEKKKQQEVLKKLKYDPKTKTIEVNGHRCPFKIDREDPDSAQQTASALSKKDRKFMNKYRQKYQSEANFVKEVNKDEDKVSNETDKYKRLRDKSRTLGSPYDKNKKRRETGIKLDGVTVGKNNLNEESILHEVSHNRDGSIRRRIGAEPSYVAKYGTKELSKEARKARLELNKLKKKEKPSILEKQKMKKLEKTLQKGIEATDSYKNDKWQQKRDQVNEMDKYIEKQIRKNKRKLNSHDQYKGEHIADASSEKNSSKPGAINRLKNDINNDYKKEINFQNSKYGTKTRENDMRKKLEDKFGKKNLDSKPKRAELATKITSSIDKARTNHVVKKYIKSTNTRAKIAKKVNKKYKDVIESCQKLDLFVIEHANR